MNKHPISIDRLTFRRFLLGKQGLFPGRRWQGKQGASDAVRAVEAVQIDPLHITARSHDLALFSRVLDYEARHLDELAHADRQAFDYGSLLFYYPIQDFPYFRAIMRRFANEGSYAELAQSKPELMAEIRARLKESGALGNRHFESNRVDSYRASKETGLALRYLWLTGEIITHSRRRFERAFAFREGLIPDEYTWEATDAQALDHFTRKSLRFLGIAPRTLWGNHFYSLYHARHPYFDQAISALVEAGEVIPVKLEGRKETRYMSAADLPLLETVAAGKIPAAWMPLDVTNDQEVLFLAPLEIVTARSRAMDVFGFDYKWEVYVPAEKRRWGYYCLPILYGDRLVGRFDPKMERKSNTLHINAFHLEDDFTPDEAFADALGRGLARFVRFNGAAHLVDHAIQPAWLKARLAQHVTFEG